MCAGKTCKTETIAPHTAQAALSTVARPHLVRVLNRDIPFILNITPVTAPVLYTP